jgi:mannose-6-phosphate isomerase-like protein (cupin superfamily)
MARKDERLVPTVIPLASAAVVERAESPIAMKLSRTLTAAEHGSKIMVGVSWMEPGEKSAVWSTETTPTDAEAHHVGPIHEFFYLIEGDCTVWWEDEAMPFRANDTFFFAPEWWYRIENTGDRRAVLIYATTPPLG